MILKIILQCRKYKIVNKKGFPWFRDTLLYLTMCKNFKLISQIVFTLSCGVYTKRKYCNCMIEKKLSPFDECSCFVCLRAQNKQKQFPFVFMSACLYVRTWSLAVDIITFGRVSGTKQNLVAVFYVWNVVLVLKSKVKSWFRFSKSTEY